MLYTYHVDIGRMLAFDMDLAMKRVRDLKKEIEKTCNIPYVNLVLFVSGGQIMDGRRIVGSYQAGTDNNPIWLVDNRTYNQNQAPIAYIPPNPDDHLQAYVENSMALPPTYDTIVTRTQLAMSFHEMSREELKICDVLVKDQHFQHQGWAALKCTLEDKGLALEKNKNRFLKIYSQFLAERKEALLHLEEYDKTNVLIRKIPIPRCLDQYAKKCAERLLRESTAPSAALEARNLSNFVSCVDRLDKSEFTSSSSSGPPSGKFTESGEESSSETPRPQAGRVGSVGGELPPLEEVEGNGVAGHGTLSSPVQIRKTGTTAPPPVHGKGQTERSRLVTGGFTSPGAQSPLSHPGTPKRLSYIEEGVDMRSLVVQACAVPVSTHDKAIRFEISPSTSVSSQTSHPGSRSESPALTRRTLSDWIRGNDSRDPMESVKRELEEKFDRLTPRLSEDLVSKCEEVQKSLDNKSMKEFKGLDRRLAGLEQLMIQMREIVRHQSDMAQGFIQNQQRAKSERDPSILPDLCSSHKRQLEVMSENHLKVGDILRRVRNAKQELCTVMHARIRWIMHMEERLREADNEVVMTQGMVSRMFSYMKTIRQVHNTPALFAEAIIEGFRRRRFATRFMEWAGSWAEENSSLYQKELDRRNEFNQHLSGHFLLRMFTGYGESPPQFATKAPDPFDSELPNITVEDIENLKKEVPEIAHLLVLPEDPDLGKKISTNTLRGASSTSILPVIGGHGPMIRLPPATSDQATSYSMSASDFQLTPAAGYTDDIVVLTASGEAGLISPSPEHKAQKSRASQPEEQAKSFAEGVEEGGDELTQSVEVISQEAGGGQEGADQYTVTRVYRKAGDLNSLSLQQPRSFEEVDAELAYHSLRSLSLDEAHFTGKSLKSPLSGTSPDLDDYATADFYIDESIPSAMSISSPDKTIADLQLQLEEKSSSLVEKEAEVRQLQTDNTDYREKAELLHSTISALKRAIHSIAESSSVPDLRADLEKLKKQTQEDVEHVKCDISLLSQQLTLLVKRLSECNENLQSKCDVLVSEAKEETRQIKEKMETHSSVLEGEWRQKLKTVEDRFEQEKLNFEKRESEFREQLREKQEEFERNLKEKQSGVREITEQIDRLKEDLRGAEQEKIELESRLGVEKELHQTGENRLGLVEQELNKVKENLGDLNTNKEGLLKDLQDTKALHEKEVETLKEDFNRQLQDQVELLKAAESDVESYKKLLEDKAAMLEAKSQELAGIESRLQELQKEKASLSQNLADMELKLNEVQEEKTCLTEKLMGMESRLEEVQEEKAGLTEKLVGMESRLKEIQEEGEERHKSEVQRHEAELQTTRAELTLEHEVEMEKVRSDLLLEVAEKEQALDSLQEQVEGLGRQLDQLRQDKDTEIQQTHQQFQTEKEELLKILKKEHSERLEESERDLREKLGEEHKQREEEALRGQEAELRTGFTEESRRLVEEKEAEVRSLLEDEYLLTLKEGLEKQEVELKAKWGEQEETRLQAALEEQEKEWQEKVAAVESKALEERQQLSSEHEQKSREMVEEAERTLREKLAQEEEVRTNRALEERERSVRGSLEAGEMERTREAVERRGEEVKREVEEEHRQRMEQLETEHTDKMKALRSEHEKEMEEQYLQSDAKLEEVRREQRERTEREQTQLSASHREILSALESEKQQEVGELKESLAFDFHKRITELRAQLEQREAELEEMKAALSGKEDVTSKAVRVLEAEHSERLAALSVRYEQEKERSLDRMKTSLTAERQVLFNEALNKAVSAKDKMIEELRKQVEKLQGEQSSVKTDTGSVEAGKHLEKEEHQQARQEAARPVEDPVRMGQSVMWASQMSQSVMSQSVIPISESSSLQDRIHQLELRKDGREQRTRDEKTRELKSKDQEIMKLKNKLDDKMGELSISQDTQILVKDKISITSCSKGDVVLLCLDEKYDHYVVFTVGATLHFLHSDCLDTLSLRPAPGESRKLWVLAEIVEKEYCQAKKAQNRFKVPMGTKFYRVRCKPWTHPSLTASSMQPPQRSQPRPSPPQHRREKPAQDPQETAQHNAPETQENPPQTDQSQTGTTVADQSEARAPVTDQSEARAPVTDQSDTRTPGTDLSQSVLSEKEHDSNSSFGGTDL